MTLAKISLRYILNVQVFECLLFSIKPSSQMSPYIVINEVHNMSPSTDGFCCREKNIGLSWEKYAQI